MQNVFENSETVLDPIYGLVDISQFEKRLLACPKCNVCGE